MEKKITILLVLAAFIASIDCHGRMMEPVNRGSAWRVPLGLTEPKFPRTTRFDAEWCAFEDRDEKRNNRNVTCGICGPVYLNDPAAFHVIYKGGAGFYANVTSFEKGSSMYDGRIVKTYKKGQNVTARVKIVANHKGVVQFRICNADGLQDDPKMECFDQNILKFDDGSDEYKLNDGELVDAQRYKRNGRPNGTEKQFEFQVKLPQDLTCEHCILQWKWFKTANQQMYYSCADVAIEE